jgi:hypothetical protein
MVGAAREREREREREMKLESHMRISRRERMSTT